MVKILITCEMAQEINMLRNILSEMKDEAQLTFLTDATKIQECLLTEDIDICFIDYETPNHRFTGILDLILARNMKTMVIIMVEPQNLAVVQQDKRYGHYIALVKPLGRDSTLFAVQQTIDDNEISRTGEYAPTVDGLWRRSKPLYAKMFWREALTGHGVLRVRNYEGKEWPSVIQSALAAGIADIDKSIALPVMVFSQLQRNEASLNELYRELSFYQVKNVFEGLSQSVILRDSDGYALFESDLAAAVFYPYDIRLPTNQIAHRCYQFCREIKKQYNADCAIIIGRPQPVTKLTDEWLAMREKSTKRLFVDQTVYIMGNEEAYGSAMTYAPVVQWGKMIVDGHIVALEDEVRAFFLANESNPNLTTDYIVNLVYELDRFVTITTMQLDYDTSKSNLMQKVRQQFTHAHRSPDDFVTWIRMQAEFCADCRQRSRQQGSAIKAAETYIQNNLDGDLSREAIAEHVHVSQNYLARLFREQRGMTVSDYIMNSRIERAAGYLTGSGLTVTEISSRVGFSSSTYFSSCFKKCTGLTPQQYRAEKGE